MTTVTGIQDISEIAQITGKHLDLSFLPALERTVLFNTLQESSDEEGLLRSFIHLLEFFSYDDLVPFYEELFGSDMTSLVLYLWKNDLY